MYKSNGNVKKAATYMNSEVQGQVWVGIRKLESTALKLDAMRLVEPTRQLSNTPISNHPYASINNL